MKITMKYVVLFFLTIYSTANFAQGIDFEQITFEKALEKAKVEDKIIFVDAYASWCGPCKAMARNVFTLKTVGDFYNKSFINLKLDMEKPEGAYVLRNYPVNAYPTLLFIDADGKLIHKKVGGMDDRNFLGLGKMVLEKTNDITTVEQSYTKGDRSLDVLYEYAKGLKRKGADYQSVANEYFRNPNVSTHPAFIKALYDLTPSTDSYIFEMYKGNIVTLESIYKTQLSTKTLSLAGVTIDKAVEFKSEELLLQAINAVYTLVPDEHENFKALSEMRFYKSSIPDFAKYYKAALVYLENHKDLDDNHKVVQDVVSTFPEKKNAKKVLTLASKTTDSGQKASYFLAHAQLLDIVGQYEKALEKAKKGLEIATTDRLNITDYELLIKKLSATLNL